VYFGRQISPKHWHLSKEKHGITSQETTILIFLKTTANFGMFITDFERMKEKKKERKRERKKERKKERKEKGNMMT